VPRGSRAPTTARARKNLAGPTRKVVGPFETIFLRESVPNRPDQLNFSVEVRPIGSKGKHDHVVARMKDPEDAKIYAGVLARRSRCRIVDYVQKPVKPPDDDPRPRVTV
jgi:hypothetical protein